MLKPNTDLGVKRKIFKTSEIQEYIIKDESETVGGILPSWIELWKNGGCSYSVYDMQDGCGFHIGYIKTTKELF